MVYDVYVQNLQAIDTVYPNFKLEHLPLKKLGVFSVFSPAYTQKQPPEVFF